ncbi:MAG: Gfo/Idh/MocA family oxidoreductase [Gammaproteobacteria bacterium]|nr:Gfo/Idh/MocA family oxidoreductase [Gammaproteobacteria bacterium]
MKVSKIRMGLVGGGEGAFIGVVHRMAAELDGLITLVCGAFSSSSDRSKRSGAEIYGLPADRCYGSFAEMIEQESQLAATERMDFVAVTTPNHVHYEVAKKALDAGFHVMCEKPLSFSVKEAQLLAQQVADSGQLFGLTHNYTGYPMIKEARELVRSGAIGTVRRISIEYIQGWLSTAEESTGENKQAEWRTDPSRSGAGGCIGDIGTHGENLAEYVTGQSVSALCADISTFVKGRQLDDDVNVLLRFANGAKGVLSASQIAVGVENNLTLRVYGEMGGIEWQQMEPNTLIVRWPDRPYEVRRTGGTGLSSQAEDATRLPAGHPEGYLEAFALLYRNFAQAVQDRKNGSVQPSSAYDFPSVDDGLRGMKFIDAVVNSSSQGAVWVDLD